MELRSKKTNKAWIWTAICKITRQIVGCVIGDRSEKTCQKLYDRIPENYRHAHTFSDLWQAYSAVFPAETVIGRRLYSDQSSSCRRCRRRHFFARIDQSFL